MLGRVADLLERNGIDVEDIGRVQRVNLYQGFYKDDEGQAHKVDMTGIQLSPAWEDGPAWPVVQPARPVRPRPVNRNAAGATQGWRVCAVLPDPQIGYRRDLSCPVELDPFHDEAAMGAALAVVKAARPDVVVHLGDLLDLPTMGSYRKEAAFALTTQPTIDRAHEWLAQCIEAAPADARHVLIEGNHDRRLLNYITDNALAAFGLRQAQRPSSWPVLSVPHLLRLDELGVEYVEGYPAGMWWLNEHVAMIHGERLKTEKVLDDEQVTVLHGHTHRVNVHQRRRRTREGSVLTWAVSPGCLCRIDGAVPSVHGSTDSRGAAVRREENWHQAVALVHYRDTGEHSIELVPISDGIAFFRGKPLGPGLYVGSGGA